MIRQLIDVFLNFILFLIDIKLKKCDEAVDYFVAALKLIPDWFITSKIIKKNLTALHANENILYFNEDSGNVVFNCDEMGIFNIVLNIINLDNNLDEDDPDIMIVIRLLAWDIKFEKRRALEKELNEELIPIVWRPNRW